MIDIGLTDKSILNGEAHKIIIRVNSLGTYTARCPIEGKIMDFRGDQPNKQVPGEKAVVCGCAPMRMMMWYCSFTGIDSGLAPRAFLRYGERVGQGQRCAYLRLTRFAEVQLPINGRVLVAAGQRVAAGSDVLAKLPHA